MNDASVLRGQIRISCEGGRLLVEAAHKHAASMGVLAGIAVVDDGGTLVAFSRMDGARATSVEIAQTKARSAARRKCATSGDGGGTFEGGVLLAMMTQLAVTVVPGGLPILVEGEVIGAIGVSGGAPSEDVSIAQAAIAAFLAG